MFFLSTIRRHMHKVFGLGALVACSLAGGSAHAAEVTPQLFPTGVLQVHTSISGPAAFSCTLAVAASGELSCGANVRGAAVAVTNQFGVVTGHRIRFTRQVSPTITESYVGAYARTAPGNPSVWITGELTITEQRQSCVQLRCIPSMVTSTPLPFSATAIFVSG